MWSDEVVEIQLLFGSDNKVAFYKNLRQIHGPSAGCFPAILTKDETQLITDKPGILEQMKEIMSDLNKLPSSFAHILVGIAQRPVLEEFDLP